MIVPVFVKSFSLPEADRREIIRYTGAKDTSEEFSTLLETALAEALPVLSGRVCWTQLPLACDNGLLDLGFAQTDSEALQRNLAGCHQIVVFAATLGLGIDRLISRYSRLSPAKALLLQAIGAERIEAFCNVFCDEIRREAECSGLHTVPRFSPGYGDFPLDMQKDIFRLLDCSRKIGLTLNESLMMSPSKSVTAIIGLHPDNTPEIPHRCSQCGKADCLYRRTL